MGTKAVDVMEKHPQPSNPRASCLIELSISSMDKDLASGAERYIEGKGFGGDKMP